MKNKNISILLAVLLTAATNYVAAKGWDDNKNPVRDVLVFPAVLGGQHPYDNEDQADERRESTHKDHHEWLEEHRARKEAHRQHNEDLRSEPTHKEHHEWLEEHRARKEAHREHNEQEMKRHNKECKSKKCDKSEDGKKHGWDSNGNVVRDALVLPAVFGGQHPYDSNDQAQERSEKRKAKSRDGKDCAKKECAKSKSTKAMKQAQQ